MVSIPRDPYDEIVMNGHISNGWNDARLGRARTIGPHQAAYDRGYEDGLQYYNRFKRLPLIKEAPLIKELPLYDIQDYLK